RGVQRRVHDVVAARVGADHDVVDAAGVLRRQVDAEGAVALREGQVECGAGAAAARDADADGRGQRGGDAGVVEGDAGDAARAVDLGDLELGGRDEQTADQREHVADRVTDARRRRGRGRHREVRGDGDGVERPAVERAGAAGRVVNEDELPVAQVI